MKPYRTPRLAERRRFPKFREGQTVLEYATEYFALNCRDKDRPWNPKNPGAYESPAFVDPLSHLAPLSTRPQYTPAEEA